ncbi:gamma-glutamyltransferase [Pararoseomonas sp. SCSIO 73927]|uniref:gamma-glutamyltransferase n=1 Tax=Pararoseomonas sp. SCSIO 73927 TaxID=3114537 RepID=UPI0030CD37AA
MQINTPEPVGTCTTHIAATDREGTTVSLTTTLLGTMGSRVVLPETGVLMNNAAMWFDPRPGKPNSVSGGKRPLTNMLPVVFVGSDGLVLAAGASGGRRILSSVYQTLAHVLDFGMDLDGAAHQPRIDVSGPDRVAADRRLPRATLAALADANPGALDVVEHGPVPLNFACPSLLARKGDVVEAVADTMTPWSCALTQ